MDQLAFFSQDWKIEVEFKNTVAVVQVKSGMQLLTGCDRAIQAHRNRLALRRYQGFSQNQAGVFIDNQEGVSPANLDFIYF